MHYFRIKWATFWHILVKYSKFQLFLPRFISNVFFLVPFPLFKSFKTCIKPFENVEMVYQLSYLNPSLTVCPLFEQFINPWAETIQLFSLLFSFCSALFLIWQGRCMLLQMMYEKGVARLFRMPYIPTSDMLFSRSEPTYEKKTAETRSGILQCD